jgi:hypothetical protein
MGGHARDLIEPVDGFHVCRLFVHPYLLLAVSEFRSCGMSFAQPSQTGNVLLAQQIWADLVRRLHPRHLKAALTGAPPFRMHSKPTSRRLSARRTPTTPRSRASSVIRAASACKLLLWPAVEHKFLRSSFFVRGFTQSANPDQSVRCVGVMLRWRAGTPQRTAHMPPSERRNRRAPAHHRRGAGRR